MNVLVACEISGEVRDAFRDRGHEAWSCDYLGPEDEAFQSRKQRWPNYHLVGDARWFFDGTGPCKKWDLLIAFPPCRFLSVSGMHWTTRGLRDPQHTEQALELVRDLMGAPVRYSAIENPVGIISSRIRKPDQTIQPYHFGHDASKRTCLWLKGLPKLRKTKIVPPRLIEGRPRWANQTDSGQNKLTPSVRRAADRAQTYEGIAAAMAEQWGWLET